MSLQDRQDHTDTKAPFFEFEFKIDVHIFFPLMIKKVATLLIHIATNCVCITKGSERGDEDTLKSFNRRFLRKEGTRERENNQTERKNYIAFISIIIYTICMTIIVMKMSKASKKERG